MIKELLLAILQSLSEFLPISSSGHLALFSLAFGKVDIFLITILHFASLLAVLIYFRKDIIEILRLDNKSISYITLIIVATIPAALFGFFFGSYIKTLFSSVLIISLSFVLSGLAIYSTKFARNKKREVNLSSAIFVGVMQTLALIPGISRSGITISSALSNGVKREDAFKFSFFLFIPLTIGANISELKNAYFNLDILFSFVVCLFLSYVSLIIVKKIVIKEKFYLFGIYNIFVGFLGITYYVVKYFFGA